jgi:hypothetical protein
MNAHRRSLLLATLTLLVAPLALAADAPAGLGTWDVVAVTPEGEMPAVLTLKVVENQLEAQFELAGAPRNVNDEKVLDNVLTMNVEYEGGVYSVQAKLDGDTMAGTWQGGAMSGTLKGKRRP